MPMHLFVEEGPDRGTVFLLEDGKEWVVGRDTQNADFVLNESTVSRKAAQITKTPDGIFVKNLSRTNPTRVNNEEISEPTILKEGDRIQVGSSVLIFSEKKLPEEKGGYDDIFGDLDNPKKTENEEPLPLTPPKPEATAYDTIFEDTSEEEPALFDLISGETPYILKVIAGPNAGAEIGIEKGKAYTIGKDPDTCDIVFQDMSVSRSHSRISVSEDGVIDIEDLSSKNGTVVNGVAIQERKIITPNDIVALGTTIFMLIDREAPQETIYSPSIPAIERPSEESLVAEEEKPSIDWKKEPIPPKYLILGGSFLVVFLVVFLSFFSLFKTNTIEETRKEPISEIKNALAKWPDVQFSYNPGSGKLFLVGHVLTNVDYQEMKYKIGQVPFVMSIDENVIIDEGVWRSMNAVISETPAWRSVSIHSPAAGKFVVTGYLDSAEEATRLAEYLTMNFPYLDRLENKVVVADILNAELQGMILKAQLGAVNFQFIHGEVILTGRYSETKTNEYELLIKEIRATPGVTVVKSLAVATHPDDAAIDVSKNYQVTGTSLFDGQGYSVVLNGKIYTIGDLVDGMKIKSIQATTILLEKDDLKYKIDYTR